LRISCHSIVIPSRTHIMTRTRKAWFQIEAEFICMQFRTGHSRGEIHNRAETRIYRNVLPIRKFKTSTMHARVMWCFIDVFSLFSFLLQNRTTAVIYNSRGIYSCAHLEIGHCSQSSRRRVPEQKKTKTNKTKKIARLARCIIIYKEVLANVTETSGRQLYVRDGENSSKHNKHDEQKKTSRKENPVILVRHMPRTIYIYINIRVIMFFVLFFRTL